MTELARVRHPQSDSNPEHEAFVSEVRAALVDMLNGPTRTSCGGPRGALTPTEKRVLVTWIAEPDSTCHEHADLLKIGAGHIDNIRKRILKKLSKYLQFEDPRPWYSVWSTAAQLKHTRQEEYRKRHAELPATKAMRETKARNVAFERIAVMEPYSQLHCLERIAELDDQDRAFCWYAGMAWPEWDHDENNVRVAPRESLLAKDIRKQQLLAALKPLTKEREQVRALKKEVAKAIANRQ